MGRVKRMWLMIWEELFLEKLTRWTMIHTINTWMFAFFSPDLLREQLSQGTSLTAEFLLVILSVAPCYDCCKALRASGLCNVFDMGDFFFSCVVTTCKQLLYGWETISSRERYWWLAGSPLPVTLKNISIQLSILDTLNLYFKYHTALLNNWTSKQRQ